MSATPAQIRAALAAVVARIDAAFTDDADKYTADRHLTLEEVSDRLTALLADLPEE